MRSRVLARRAQRRDDGFTLMESVVALTLAVIIFMALSFALIGGMHEVLFSQQNQQAGDVMNQTVENIRALSYDSIVMQDSDLDTNDSRSPSLSSALFYNWKTDSTCGAQTTQCEKIVHAAIGGVVPHVTTVTQNGGKFTVKRYITKTTEAWSAAGPQYKRLTVVVTWTSGGKTHTRMTSTYISPTKRGLPLPNFKFSNIGSLAQCRNPGSTIVYQFNVANNGARDQWLISTSSATPTWSLYDDTNGNNAYDSGVDQPMGTFNGSPTTGLLDTTVNHRFFAVTTASAGAPYTWTIGFTATSAAIPTYQQTLTTTTTVIGGVCGAPTPTPTTSSTPTPTPTSTSIVPPQPSVTCSPINGTAATTSPGGTLQRYWLYNPGQPGNTVASQGMPVVKDSGTSPASGPVYDYSTDLAVNTAGRDISAPVGTNTTAPYVASWTYQMPAQSKIKGDGELTMYGALQNTAGTTVPNVRVTIDWISGSTVTTLDTETLASSTNWLDGCAGFHQFSVGLSGIVNSGVTINANDQLRITVAVTNNVPIVLGYGTASYPAEFSIPYSQGVG